MATARCIATVTKGNRAGVLNMPKDWLTELAERQRAKAPPPNAHTTKQLMDALGTPRCATRRFIEGEVAAGRMACTHYCGPNGKSELWVWPIEQGGGK